MKKSKVISLVLLLFLICALLLSPSVAAQEDDPQDSLIKQVLVETVDEFDWGPWDDEKFIVISCTGILEEVGCYAQYLPCVYVPFSGLSVEKVACEAASMEHPVQITSFKTEQKAALLFSQEIKEFGSKKEFHGYPAVRESYEGGENLAWQAGRFTFFACIATPTLEEKKWGIHYHYGTDLEGLAEELYEKAVKYGLIVGEGEFTQDSDGDRVADDVDQCLDTPAGVAVDDKGCPIGMQLSVSTDKKTYSPGETVIIRGSVWDAKGGLDGATVAIDVDGTKLTATAYSTEKYMGKYKCNFSLPAGITLGTHTVTATASYSGYPSVSESTSFIVGQEALIVEISTDKENYLIGETVYCTITVKDAATGKLVPYANLKVITTRLKSGKATELSGLTDGVGQNLLSFTWGKKESGEAITEGKLKIEVTASKEGYADGHKSIILSGCGDLECAEVEDCFDCFEDCKCGANEICDPLSKYTDPKTKCSPKVAYIFISNDPDLGAAQRLKMLPRINHIRKYYQSRGYKTSTVYVDDIHDVARYLSGPSTKAIAYFGHATKPSIEHSPPGDIQNNILQKFRVNYGAKYPDLKEEIKNKAKERAAHPDLDYAYMFTCHSLDDTSLRDYLLHSGGTYWGDKGKLYGLWGLQKSVKP